MPVNRTDDFTILMRDALRNRNRIVNIETLAKAIMESDPKKRREFVKDEELKNPFEFLVLNQLATLFYSHLVPKGMSGIFDQAIFRGSDRD